MNRLMSFVWVLLLMAGDKAIAQNQAVTLAPDSAILAALAHNRQVTLAGLDEQIADADYRKTDAAFLPEVAASYTALTTNNPLLASGR